MRCQITKPDGTTVDFEATHTFNHEQIEWFQAGGASTSSGPEADYMTVYDLMALLVLCEDFKLADGIRFHLGALACSAWCRPSEDRTGR